MTERHHNASYCFLSWCCQGRVRVLPSRTEITKDYLPSGMDIGQLANPTLYPDKSRWNCHEIDWNQTGMVQVMLSCPFLIIYIPCFIYSTLLFIKSLWSSDLLTAAASEQSLSISYIKLQSENNCY